MHQGGLSLRSLNLEQANYYSNTRCGTLLRIKLRRAKGGVTIMGLLELLAVVLLVMWLGGMGLNIAGGAIHLLLVLAVIVFAMRLFRRAV